MIIRLIREKMPALPDSIGFLGAGLMVRIVYESQMCYITKY